MSNNEAFTTIENTELTHINGGVVVEAEGGPGGVKGRIETSRYESCLEGNQRQAREAFPDNRWWWQKLMGQPDPNARPRADYERAGTGQCTVP